MSGRVVLIATGGTIASLPTPGGVTVSLDGDEVLATVPEAARAGVAVEVIDLAQGASWNLSPAALERVVSAARDALGSDGVTGAVITHGTDVLEETAFLAHLLVPAAGRGPVVVTGAMRNAAEVGADGPRNLADALAVAASPAGRGRGSLVVMNGEIHSGRWATKTHTSSLATFRSPAGAVLGSVGADRSVAFSMPPGVSPPPPDLPDIPDVDLDVQVAVVVSHSGVDGEIVAWHVDRGARGIVVVGSGAGNVNEALVPGIEAAVARDVPVVVASRAPTGKVAPIYGGPGGHASLARIGVISSGDLGWVRARLALAVALSHGVDARDYLTALAA